MSKKVYIVSGMTDSISYTFYTKPESKQEVAAIKEKITVLGGRGLPSNRSGFGNLKEDFSGNPLWTAEGIVTPMPVEKYERLKEHPHFKRHLAQGRLKVMHDDVTGNHKAVKAITRDMAGPDSHSLLTRDKVKERVKVKTASELLKEESHRI